MSPRTIVVSTLVIALGMTAVMRAQPPGAADTEPLLRLSANGPTSYVTSLAFSVDGQTLLAGGWDKVAHAWRRDSASNAFRPDPAGAYRVPIGPGLQGAVNAMALSRDGEWLAIAGKGTMRETAGFRTGGLIVRAAGTISTEARLDEGVIYLIHTRTRAVRTLRGHAGPILAMSFVPTERGAPATLCSLAQDWDEGAGRFVGMARFWNVAESKELAARTIPEANLRIRPAVVPWRTGSEIDQAMVAIAFGAQKLFV